MSEWDGNLSSFQASTIIACLGLKSREENQENAGMIAIQNMKKQFVTNIQIYSNIWSQKELFLKMMNIIQLKLLFKWKLKYYSEFLI